MSEDEVDRIMKQHQKFIYEPKNTLTIFNAEDYIQFDFESQSWKVGEVHTYLGNPIFYMFQNSSIAQLSEYESRDNSNFIVSGGVSTITFQLQKQVYGVEFMSEMERINLSYENDEMSLDIGRAMHESCIVNTPEGKRLLLIGGKIGNSISTCQCTDSVIGFDLKYILQPGLRERAKTDKQFRQKFDKAGQYRKLEWKNLAPMKSARSNFAHSIFKDKVFVYGGIKGSSKGDQSHYPDMSSPLCEVYDAVKNEWTEVVLDGARPLAFFGYSKLTPVGDKIILVGGSDGDLMEQSTFVINFAAKKMSTINDDIGFQTGMSKVIYDQKTKCLYSFGGFGSGGLVYHAKLVTNEDCSEVKFEGEWQEHPKNHLSIQTGQQIDLD
mmetsp:Transcript_17851/g.30293  ORF Transcript_17851/g.30293 Transcript_17851/m.30293 type:complete len:381 (-) Transcript_17851:148-1290(-)